jgi:hypothetical protein
MRLIETPITVDPGPAVEGERGHERYRGARPRRDAARHRSQATYRWFSVVAIGDGRAMGSCSIMLHHELLRQ